MSSSETINIDLRKAVVAPIDLQLTLGDAFFAALDQSEILGGEVEANVHVRATAGESFIVSIKINGEVRVSCDRCLEELTLPVSTEERMTLRYGNEADAQDDDYDVTVIPFTATTYDISWDLYEFIELALPLQRTHNPGDCNEEVLQYINRE